MKKQDNFDDFLLGLGRTVKKYRTEAQMTQEQLAKAIGSESDKDMRSYISKLENGQRNPPASVLKRIGEVLHVPACTLLDEATDVQKEIQLCNLFEECHGKEAFRMVQQFLKLDHEDRNEVVAMIQVKLAKEKYREKVASSEDVAM